LQGILKKDGLLGVISFHSGEDKLVKEYLTSQIEAGLLAEVTKKPIVPSKSELLISPRTRSAKLRIAKKIN